MRSIVNLFLSFGVLYFGAKFMPETLSFDSTQTMFFTALAMWLISWVLTAILIPFVLGGAVAMAAGGVGTGAGCLTIIISFLVMLFSTPLELYIADIILEGFSISGFWTYVLMAIALSIFHISAPSKSSSSTSTYSSRR